LCKNVKLVEIVYGFATETLFKQEKAGRIKIGGCVVVPGCPDLYCPGCGNAWNSKSGQKFVMGLLGEFLTPEKAEQQKKWFERYSSQ